MLLPNQRVWVEALSGDSPLRDEVPFKVVVHNRVSLDYSIEREELNKIGADIVEIQPRNNREFIEHARDADALIAQKDPISSEIIDGLEKCLIIGVPRIGVDIIDIAAATRQGIIVTNTPDVFIEEVADHTMAMLLASARRLKDMDLMTRAGDWFKGRPSFATIPRLWGQTLGLISFGNVAQAVARRAKPFGLHVIAHDPYVSELKMTNDGVGPVSLFELLERSDFVSMHAPLNRETEHMLTSEHFAVMKNTAIFVNNGRGPTVDEAALTEALRTKKIAGAALDVFEQEPPDLENELLHMPNVIVTPHIASASSRMAPESRRRMAREIALVLTGRWPMSCVNSEVLPKSDLIRWQPYPMDRGPSR